MEKNGKMIILITGIASTAFIIGVGYFAYYHARYGAEAYTPLGAWIATRRRCDELDAELDKILKTPESR